MVKRALTLLTSILIALPLLMPFNIYADTLSQSEIVGVTYNKIDETVSYLNGSGTWIYVYEIKVLLRNKYVGVVDGTLSYSYSENQSGQTITTSKRTYVNGDSFKLNVSIVQFGSSYSGSSPMYSASFLVNAQNTNVTKYEDLTSIDSIISILDDIYTNSSDIENLSTNQLLELEKIVQNTSLANQYLDYISQLRQYNIPIESFSFIFQLRNYNLWDFQSYKYLDYPIFNNIGANSSIVNLYSDKDKHFYIIMGIQSSPTAIDYISRFNDLFSYSSNFSINEFKFLEYFSGLGTFIYVDFLCNEGGFIQLKNKRTIDYLLPIYLSNKKNNVSTDFALQWGLSNQLLDDLDIIANGTTASQSSAQSSDSANEQLKTDSNTLFEQENGFKSDMQSAMQNVNNTFRLQDMGTKFVSSAQWVRTQYEQMTNNTPFASLITFSLITGLALILLGKVYK